MFTKFLVGLSLVSLPAFAASVNSYSSVDNGVMIQSPGSVSTVFLTSATQAISVTVPYFANAFTASGDGAWVCENNTRCGTTFPVGTVSQTGFIYMPKEQRTRIKLPGNLQISQSVIWVYPRNLPVASALSGTAVESFEWYSY